MRRSGNDEESSLYRGPISTPPPKNSTAWPLQEALSGPISKLYSIRWRKPEDEVAEESDLRQNGEWRGEKEHLTQNGQTLHVETRVTMMQYQMSSP